MTCNIKPIPVMYLGLNLSAQYPTNSDDMEKEAERGMKNYTASAFVRPWFSRIEIILNMKPVLNAELLDIARAAIM